MSGHHEQAPERKGTTRDFLRLPAKAPADEQLITSSPRAKKKDGASLATPPAKRLNTGKQLQPEAQVRGCGKQPVSDALQDLSQEKDISQQKVEELASPELRRRHDDVEDNRYSTSLDNRNDIPGNGLELPGRSDGFDGAPHDLRPDTSPSGVLPLPQFQTDAREPTPEASGDARQRGVLKSIFSPVFQLFHPGKQEGDLSKHVPKPVKLRENGTPPRARSRSPEEWAKVAEDDAQPGNPEIQKAETTTLLRAPIGDSPSPGDPALKCRPAASDGASSTDGESETCLTARSPVATSREAKEGPESDSESEMGEETCAAELSAVPANDEEDGDNDLYEFAFDPYSFIKSLPPLENCVPAWRRALLPKQTRNCKQKTLVLDLDETLVHSTLDFGEAKTDFMFEVSLNNKKHCVNVRQRPHMSRFLQRCAELFELVIFTASQKLYAEQLLNIIDPGRKLIRHRIYRDSCLFVEGNYLKDLTLLGRDLAHTLIIDNSPQAFGFQLANGVPIESWYDDDSDDELLRMLPFLESLVDVPDVRPYIMNAFKLHALVDQAPGYV